MEDEDPVVPVVAVVVFILFILLFIRIFCYLFQRETRGREEDVEHLDPSIAFESGCGSFTTLFNWCSDTREGGGDQDPPRQHGNRHELQPTPERKLDERTEQTTPERKLDERTERLVHDNGVQEAIKRLEALQGETDSKAERLKIIRLVQNLILLHEDSPTGGSLQTALVIGVDATPKVVGGYCVNLRDMRLEYYVIKMEDFPWPLESENNPSEFEMKNLIFALATWNKLIRKYKSFRIYTDNHSISSSNSGFGLDARDLLEHFTECGDAKLINQNLHINRSQELARFAKYIQAADDFSRWEVDKGIDFLCGFYGIDKNKVSGTLKLMRNATIDSKAWYDPSPAYNQYITRAKTYARNFRCENCIIDTFTVDDDLGPSSRSNQLSNGNGGGRSNKANKKLRRLQQNARNVLGNNGNAANGGGGKMQQEKRFGRY